MQYLFQDYKRKLPIDLNKVSSSKDFTENRKVKKNRSDSNGISLGEKLLSPINPNINISEIYCEKRDKKREILKNSHNNSSINFHQYYTTIGSNNKGLKPWNSHVQTSENDVAVTLAAFRLNPVIKFTTNSVITSKTVTA